MSSYLISPYVVKTNDTGDRNEPKSRSVQSSHLLPSPTRCVTTFVADGRSCRKFSLKLTLQNVSPTWFSGFRRRLRHLKTSVGVREKDKKRVWRYLVQKRSLAANTLPSPTKRKSSHTSRCGKVSLRMRKARLLLLIYLYLFKHS